MPPMRAKMCSAWRRWLSEIEKPPSTEATPNTTPRVCRIERPGFSRISIHDSAQPLAEGPGSLHAASASGACTRPSRSSTRRWASAAIDGSWVTSRTVLPWRCKLLEQRQHFLAGLGIERAGGLVGEQQRRPVGERAGDRHALTLAARERSRQHVGLLGNAHLLEQLQGARAALAPRHAGVEHRQLDVAHDGGLGQQVVLLEDEADLLVANRRQLGAGQPLDLRAVEREGAGGRAVEAAEDRHQRALARARGPDQGHELAAGDVEVDAAQGVHRGAVGAVDLGQAAGLDNRRCHVASIGSVVLVVLLDLLARHVLERHLVPGLESATAPRRAPAWRCQPRTVTGSK